MGELYREVSRECGYSENNPKHRLEMVITEIFTESHL